ncbi:hypothetical protein QLL95_gp0326 [Cotonvirus japonicus]|uniref:Uncharacterized protein n=1 Tax=Cotonvirus japonicus TaxID=2811091 RepID=A0ABM7NRM4_9VIRU|nr:hypothetical protein QLL95_gp0326 [Cotonvirus japonicus]BCS82815.1 hypothetical protein [Cotonvirus japonicus]
MQFTATTCWVGPYGVLVPNSIDNVVAEDGYNTLYKDGSETEKFCLNAEPMSSTIYRAKYAIYNETDGLWYHKTIEKIEEFEELEEFKELEEIENLKNLKK